MKDTVDFKRRKFLRQVNALLKNAESIYNKLEAENHFTEYVLKGDNFSVVLCRPSVIGGDPDE